MSSPPAALVPSCVQGRGIQWDEEGRPLPSTAAASQHLSSHRFGGTDRRGTLGKSAQTQY